ncbi:hypothetical protein BD626DRAFT_621116 [Schizophyllum amplum]|uniref:Uncharacterized protein n=1 Tax=Schizophyllum amplum TaxID=97359 RepID=A0A550CHI9_9AGAR|nr:hypothetical protein BD626DRAFT_621116 [Auriculariopsis ampla]
MLETRRRHVCFRVQRDNAIRRYALSLVATIRAGLMGCFMRQNNLLTILTSISRARPALRMYTTTYKTKGPSLDGKPRHRLRLDYRSSPALTSASRRAPVDVKTLDRFVYLSVRASTFRMGDDPNEHYGSISHTCAARR